MSDRESQPANPTTRTVYPEVIPSIIDGHHHHALAYIKTHGKTTNYVGDAAYDLHFDTTASDPIATEYRRILDQVKLGVADVRANAPISLTMAQDTYEHALISIIKRAASDTMFSREQYRKAQEGGTTSRNLNLMTSKDEYDCEHFSFIYGLLMHEADHHAVQLGLRTNATQFYFMDGATSELNTPDIVLSGHTYIVSAATGNIIEATSKERFYKTTNIDFRELAAGYPALTADDLYISSSVYTLSEKIVQERLSILHSLPHDTESLGRLTLKNANPDIASASLLARSTQHAMENKNAFVAQCTNSAPVNADNATTVQTQAGYLQAYETLDQQCVEERLLTAKKMYLTTHQSIQLAKNYTSSAKLPFADVSEADEYAPKKPASIPTQPYEKNQPSLPH